MGEHTLKGIQLQIEGNSSENLKKRSENVKYFVAVDNSKVVGICGYDKYKVHTLFVDIEYHKRGIGGKLLDKVLYEAANEGIKSLITWSTIYAEQFYSNKGFQKVKKVIIPPDKEDIVLIEMLKRIGF